MRDVPTPAEPALVQRVRYMRDPIGYMHACRKSLGDVFMLELFEPGMVFACTPELAKAIYTADEDTLVAGQAKIKVFGKVLGQSSSLLLDGAAHLARRRLLLPRFRGEVMEALAPVMTQACASTLATLPIGRRFALHPYMHRIAFEVISHALFAHTPAARLADLESALRGFANHAVTSRLLMFPALQRDFGRLSPWGRVKRVVERARRAVRDELHARRRETSATDLAGLLADARDEHGVELDEAAIVDEILTMIAAGHETTAMAATWLCYAVFTRPAVVERLRAEAAAHPALRDRRYLEAVIRESLRFYSTIPNGSGRLAKRAFTLGERRVPAGALVTIAIHEVHREAAVFERPAEFMPERFLDEKYSPYESIAFGGGTRRCLGMPFALQELGVILAAVLERFTLEVDQRDVHPVWRARFLTPNRGLLVRVKPVARA